MDFHRFENMNRLMSFLLPGVVLMILFSVATARYVSLEISSTDWFVYLSFFVYVLCVVIPCVLYYIKTPPGIDHK